MSEPVTTKAPGRRRMYLLVRMLCEGGLMIALALVLGLLKVFELPQGGSISLEMLPPVSYTHLTLPTNSRV